MPEFTVKGSSVRSKFDFVRDRFGEEAVAAMREHFADRARLTPVLDSADYPFALYDEIIRFIADRFFGSQLGRLRDVGAYSAEKVLTGVYRAYAEGRDFPGFLDHVALLHERFYSQGTMRVELGDDRRSATIHLTGAPAYSEADLQVAAGFYTGAARLLGHGAVTCRFEEGVGGVRFDLGWS